MKENLFYLPPYEDEATAEKIREIYGYPIRYMKQYLLDFFTALYEEQHHDGPNNCRPSTPRRKHCKSFVGADARHRPVDGVYPIYF